MSDKLPTIAAGSFLFTVELMAEWYLLGRRWYTNGVCYNSRTGFTVIVVSNMYTSTALVNAHE